MFVIYTDGFGRWNYPDAGANQDLSQCADCNSTTGYNDFRFINSVGEVIDGKEGVIQYIQYAADQAQAMGNKPFFMVISLINPHDVLFQPAQFDASGYPPEYLQGDVPLPPTINQTFDTRPTCQAQYQTIGLQSGVTPSTPDQQHGYMYVHCMEWEVEKGLAGDWALPKSVNGIRSCACSLTYLYTPSMH